MHSVDPVMAVERDLGAKLVYSSGGELGCIGVCHSAKVGPSGCIPLSEHATSELTEFIEEPVGCAASEVTLLDPCLHDTTIAVFCLKGLMAIHDVDSVSCGPWCFPDLPSCSVPKATGDRVSLGS